ncbi:XylR family transcriptional regulator [Oceaniferula spumae]|uniref:XylR family transcriptional regulator n=1 Tax=Oceaniferula spumae TaxID=2979115 RepID=A0AAT9FP62_9BACT
MKSEKRYDIAVIFPDWYSFLHSVMYGILEIRGIRHHCNFRNFIHKDFSTAVEFPHNYQPDGVLASFDNEAYPALWLKGLKLPVVNVFSTENTDFPAIGLCNDSLATLVVDHFLALGFQEIGYLETESLHPGKEVHQLLEKKCAERNIPYWSLTVKDGIQAGSWSQLEESAPDLRERLLRKKRRIGIYTTHDMRGRLLADYCTELGLQVPEEVGILGRFDSINSRLCTPELSSIVMPGREIGELAIQTLVNLIEGKPITHHQLVKASEIRVRESTVGRSNPDMIVLQARAMIREKACRGLTVDELTQSLPLARSTFEKRYRALTGSTPAQDIRQFRLQAARKLLLTTHKTIDEVASAIGFTDPRPFVVFFKREVGVTPGEFRKEHEA